jgi:uncharacterized membrane protein YhfC
MSLYGILTLLVGIGLLISAAGMVVTLRRRLDAPYALLTVGIITYLTALLVQALMLRLLDRALLGILPLGALAVGLVAGFTEEIARFLGYQVLAPGATTRAQAVMIGAGHGLAKPVYTGLVAISLGLSALGNDAARPDHLARALGGTLAEALNSLLPALASMALSWIVLRVFLRGEWFWLFVAIFCHAVIEIMATLLGPDSSWLVAGWRGLVALVSVAAIVRLRPPHLAA